MKGPNYFFILSILFIGFGHTQVNAQRMTIDVSAPGHTISPALYRGMLFEEINYGVDGGFYAQLIRNGSFEDMNNEDSGLDAWSVVTPGTSIGHLAIETGDDVPLLNDAQIRCLALNITSVESGNVGAANEGYWGIRIDGNTTYRISFLAKRNVNYSGNLIVQIEQNDGKILAASELFTPTTEWKKFTCELTTGEIADISPDNRIVIYGTSTGTVYLDVVRAMPPTYKNRPNGLRKDMAEMEEALHPKIIRFPGGCDIEHTTVEGGWNWKKAIGPIEERPGEREQKWGYRNSQQFGLDEMFQMCEDWGAEPIYCTSMSLNEKTGMAPMSEMQPFIQDVLDLIEYANGDARTTYWGKKRAENGHPESYHLKYIEIGNENGFTSGYHERYALFYKAIKKAYPEMNLIINDLLKSQQADLIDEHWYQSLRDMLLRSTRYDNYDRQGPKVIITEYSGKERRDEVGNLKTAIGEAAFLTGCERNSDIVVSTSFGTLSANLNYINFHPDLFYNNSMSCFAIPSYYVIKMFGDNTGDVVLPYSLTGWDILNYQTQLINHPKSDVWDDIPYDSPSQGYSFTHSPEGPLFVAPSLEQSTGEVIIKVVNPTSLSLNTEIILKGLPKKLKTKGSATVLTSSNMLDEDSISQPHKVVPFSNEFEAGSDFNYTFRPISVTVLRINCKTVQN